MPPPPLPTPQNLTPFILLAPLVGFVALGLFGRVMPRALVALIGCGVVAVAFALAVWQFASMLPLDAPLRASERVLWTWVTSGKLRIDFGLLLDPLSALMLLVVTGVGLLIHIYSIGYMEDDAGYWRFFAYLNLFILAMALLVSADNFLFLLVGWAGVGLASFLLIGFWYTRPAAIAAARKAFVVNVIGDFGLMIAIFLIIGVYGSLEYSNTLGTVVSSGRSPLDGPLLNHVSLDPNIALAIALLLFVAAAAKSAQLPLHVWLPDAMEGPTPVSALIHAATMVTAGVYLVARASSLFTAAPLALTIVGVVGCATALYAATIACVQNDIKRVLAYSTMSQLGYMFLGEGALGFSSGIFHLVTHAFFKALLFLSAGAVIHAVHAEDGKLDLRKAGGLGSSLRFTFVMFVLGGLALAAIVPLAGFWSKDAVLGAVLQRASGPDAAGWYVLYAVGLLTEALTGFYIFRLIFSVFLGRYRGGEIPANHDAHAAPTRVKSGTAGANPLRAAHEVGLAMRVPMGILAVLTIVGGAIGLPFGDWIGGFLDPVLHSAAGLQPGNPLLYIAMVASQVFALAGIGVAWLRYGRREPQFARERNPLVRLLSQGYYVDALYDALLVRPTLALGRFTQRFFEDGALDGGARGIGAGVGRVSQGLRALQTGFVRAYALGILLGAVVIVAYLVMRS